MFRREISKKGFKIVPRLANESKTRKRMSLMARVGREKAKKRGSTSLIVYVSRAVELMSKERLTKDCFLLSSKLNTVYGSVISRH